MINSIYITEFRENELKKATADFWKDTEKSVLEKMPDIVEKIKNTFAELFLAIARIQEDKPVGRITISLLRVSAGEERQRARIEVYDKDEITGKLLYDTDMDISYLFAEWESYRHKLEMMAEEKGVRRYITDPVIRFLMEEKLTDMASYLYAVLKYILIDADEIPNYELLNTIPGFMITAGEYMDWQNALFAEVPPIDLRQITEETHAVFARFEKENYKDLHIKDCNLSKTKFTDCRFQSCTFENVKLNDALFQNCYFKDVIMKSGTMYGAIMKSCIRMNSDFSRMKTEWKPFQGTDEEYDIYQNAVGIDTKIPKGQETENPTDGESKQEGTTV